MNIRVIEEIAKELKCDPAMIYAIIKVESPKGPFLPSGKPVILFEAKVFWGELIKRGINPIKFLDSKEKLDQNYDILAKTYEEARKLYKGGEKEYLRLEKAKLINEEAALCSISIGKPQIMIFNFKECGYKSAKEMFEDFSASEDAQDKAFIKFCSSNKNMLEAIRKKDFTKFAKLYNGPKYYISKYDNKIRDAYLQGLKLYWPVLEKK